MGNEPDMANALLTFYHKWDNSRKYVDAFDVEEGAFYISGQGMEPWNPINNQTRFFIDNIRTGLDEPGEWFLDQDGTLLYIPLEGQKLDESTFYAPAVQQFLLISFP